MRFSTVTTASVTIAAMAAIGDATAESSASGPSTLKSGEVVEIKIPFEHEAKTQDGKLVVEIAAYYSHVAAAGEFRFVAELVIRDNELLTSDAVVGGDDVLEGRPVMSGGSGAAA